MNRYGLIAVIARMSYLCIQNTIISPRFVFVAETSASSMTFAEDFLEGQRYQLQNIKLADNEKIVGTQIIRLEY